jgi:ubiquinone biosynthesis protein
MRFLRLALRFWIILLLCTGALIAYFGGRIALGRTSALNVERLRGARLASLFERLGATFVKFGQILSTRPDVLGPGYTEELARLQDAVPAARFSVMERVLNEDLGKAGLERIAHIDPVPVAAASVAQVHAARLASGERAALKIQRPEARSQIERDFAILEFGARLLDALPLLKPLSLPGAIARFGDALRAQLDFKQEAAHNRRFAANFAGVAGVAVPKLFDDLCTPRVLAMEFIDGIKATEPERVGRNRQKLAQGGAQSILKMVFVDGFVHADLHPGNIILSNDGRLVMIDFGVVSEIPPDLMRPWVELFVALARRDGAAAARLFYVYAPSVDGTDYPAFERDVVAYFEALYGKKLAEVEVSQAVSGLMNVLRHHRVQVDATFTVVNIALLVAEGLGKQLDPTIDLVPLAAPYLEQALLSAPPARPPLREVQ